jgi:hypothetical protein
MMRLGNAEAPDSEQDVSMPSFTPRTRGPLRASGLVVCRKEWRLAASGCLDLGHMCMASYLRSAFSSQCPVSHGAVEVRQEPKHVSPTGSYKRS